MPAKRERTPSPETTATGKRVLGFLSSGRPGQQYKLRDIRGGVPPASKPYVLVSLFRLMRQEDVRSYWSPGRAMGRGRYIERGPRFGLTSKGIGTAGRVARAERRKSKNKREKGDK